MKNYTKRPKDVSKAISLLRQQGVLVGLPMQKADGEMIFPVGDFTITVAQLLDLLDKNDPNREGIRRFINSQKDDG